MGTPRNPISASPGSPQAATPDVGRNVTALIGADVMKFRGDMEKIHALAAERTEELNALAQGIQEADSKQRETLDAFLDSVGLPSTEESRYAAYMRIAHLREGALLNLFESGDFDQAAKDRILSAAFEYAKNVHMGYDERILAEIDRNELLTPFYRTLLRGAHKVGLRFNAFQQSWNTELINGVNRRIDERFGKDHAAAMRFLSENGLFDRGHGGENADRSYSILRESGESYVRLAYAEAFPKEVSEIVAAIRALVLDLSTFEDDVYGQHGAYGTYLSAIADAFEETDPDRCVERWAAVDVAWMSVTGPFQITHPLEYYEDKFRKAVAPEWDVRLRNDSLFASVAKTSVETAFETIAADKGLSADNEAHAFSKSSLNRTQLHISTPLFFYGAFMNGLFSAQVVPNDAEVSRVHGKKIFSFAQTVLKRSRAQPKMKLSRLTLSDAIRKKCDEVVFGPDERFYRLYDVETIGHEFGHTLWMELDTEPRMNESGEFKNVEEWKATMGGLVAFLMNGDEVMKEDVIVDFIVRSVNLIAWMKEEESVPYYCEALVHLTILFDSGIVFRNSEGAIEMNEGAAAYEAFKRLAMETYSHLADVYLAKSDATEFLDCYAVRENGYFLPTDPRVREFVEWYYDLYEKFGNAVDDAA